MGKVYIIIATNRPRQEVMEEFFAERKKLEAAGYEVAAIDLDGPGTKTMPCSGSVINRPLFIAGVGLQHMACCDSVHLVPGWADDPRCAVEYRASVAFRLEEV